MAIKMLSFFFSGVLAIGVSVLQPQPPKSRAEIDSREFISKVTQSGIIQTKLGNLAEKKTNDPRVRNFGKNLVQEQTSTATKLNELAKTGGLSPATSGLSQEQYREVDRIAHLEGDEFDWEFIQLALDVHIELVKLFEAEAQRHGAQPLGKFAKNHLPALRANLESAEILLIQLDTDYSLDFKEEFGSSGCSQWDGSSFQIRPA